MTLEAEINLYCPKCKKDITQKLDPADRLVCAACGSVLHCIGFNVVDM